MDSVDGGCRAVRCGVGGDIVDGECLAVHVVGSLVSCRVMLVVGIIGDGGYVVRWRGMACVGLIGV